MKKLLIILLAAISVLSAVSCKKSSRDYPIKTSEVSDTTEASVTEPEDESDKAVYDGFIDVNIGKDDGYDVYMAPEGISGYRYGPSFIVYEDGTVDAWFASGGSSLEQWDWITYKHFDGTSWSEEKCVLQPTPNALDHYSCCDPGVIYINGYYYLAYTSTLNENQADNNLFVARSTDPDGPYEKWNGNGWGGNDPQPIVYFSEDQALWGIGEASFVELDGVLYIYYTVKGSGGHNTVVATADAKSENWPATMEYKGIALKDSTCDALDVKYADEYGKFLAVGAEKRLSEESFLAFYESSDGLTFTKIDSCKKNVYEFCHNPGLAGSENGHILPGRKTFVGYAYGSEWGVWNTRIQEITLAPTDRTDFLEESAKNIKISELPRDTRDAYSLDYVGISAQMNCVVRAPVSQEYIILSLSACKLYHDEWFNLHNFRDEVELYGYDENVIKRSGDNSLMFEVIGVGETMVTVEFRGHLTYVYVIVHEDSADGEMTSLEPLVQSEYVIDRSVYINYQPQIKSIARYDDGSWEMIWASEESGITYDYDPEFIEVNENGYILPKKAGTHTVTVSCKGFSYDITVKVILPDISVLTFESSSLAHDLITQENNVALSVTDEDILCLTTTDSSDPFVTFSLTKTLAEAKDYSSFSIKYMVPSDNALDSYSAQVFFRCDDRSLGEELSQRFELVCDGNYYTISLDLSDKSYWSGNISDIRIDFFDTCETGDVFYIESIVLN